MSGSDPELLLAFLKDSMASRKARKLEEGGARGEVVLEEELVDLTPDQIQELLDAVG